jgi:uncharacterized membrane protein
MFSDFLIRIRSVLVGKRCLCIVVLFIIAYVVFFSTYTILRHYSYQSTAWDLGVYEQALWTTANDGKLLYYTPDLMFNPGGSFLGVHFSPILLMVLPIYTIFQTTETLLIFQSCILAIGAIPVYWLARDELKSEKVGLVLSVVYLLYTPLHFVNIYDFHVEAFLPAFFLFSFHYFRNQDWRKYFIFLSLSLFTIEYIPAFLGICLGLYSFLLEAKTKRITFGTVLAVQSKQILAVLKNKRIQVGLSTILFSVAIFISASIVKTSFNGSGAVIPHLMWIYGKTPESLLIGMISNPLLVMQTLISSWSDKLLYLAYIFGPLVFLSFLDPLTLLLTTPWLLVAFLSSSYQYYTIVFQYSGFVVPFAFISTIYGMKRLLSISPKNANKLIRIILAIVLLATLSSVIFFGPLGVNTRLPSANGHDTVLDKMLLHIPPNSSVLTQNDLFPHVCKRTNAYLYPPSLGFTFDYVLADVHSWWFSQKDPVLGITPSLAESFSKMTKSGEYGIYASEDGVLLLKHNYVGDGAYVVPYHASFAANNLTYPDMNVQVESSSDGSILIHQPSGNPSTVFWYGPYESIPPGLYEVSFRLKSSSHDTGHLLTLEVSTDNAKTTISSKEVSGADFPQSNEWKVFTIEFSNSDFQAFEFRGLEPSSSVTIYLDHIELNQISAKIP